MRTRPFSSCLIRDSSAAGFASSGLAGPAPLLIHKMPPPATAISTKITTITRFTGPNSNRFREKYQAAPESGRPPGVRNDYGLHSVNQDFEAVTRADRQKN